MTKKTTEHATRRRDTALALVFVALLLHLLTALPHMPKLAAAICLLALAVPSAFHYPAKAWFGLSHLLGAVMSKVVLALVYYLFLTPLALAKRLLTRARLGAGRDATTMMLDRNHAFGPRGFRNPF